MLHKKRMCAAMLACAFAAVVSAGCGEETKELPAVNLSVWCAHDDITLMNKMIESFKENYGGEAVFQFTISEEEEDSCKDTILTNIDGAADVFSFPDDQFTDLINADALLEIPAGDADEIMSENGSAGTGAVTAALSDGKLYAIPSTASNGYFLYYNKEYFDEESAGSFDSILEIAEKNNKKVTMDLTSGWYLYSFFKGAGLDVGINDDMRTNHCNWNTADMEITGRQVAEAIINIASSPAFLTDTNDAFVNGLKDGSVIAGINGTWNAKNVEEAFGENYAAAKLPTFTIDGKQYQMHSFAGYKLIGVNGNTSEPEWAVKFARWITNEENQMLRFIERGEGPSNVKAAASDEVKSNPAIAALIAQSQFSHRQDIASTYWTPTNYLGIALSSGTLKAEDIQPLLDTVTEQITAEPAEEE